jgi:acetoin utilization deacetylase AcuC-like enzyme/GNAT superfamily N-acetyltransferase
MSDAVADPRARLLLDPQSLQYDFGPEHPMHSRRLQALLELLAESNLWHADNELTRLHGRPASEDELRLIHTPDYIAMIQRLSAINDQTPDQQELLQEAERYGIEDGDTPAFPGMHAAAATVTGGTLVALNTVMGLPNNGESLTGTTQPLHVFHPAGGWHHAWADRASGFCIYNDIAVAIAHVLQTSEAKVAYIDFDAHHGDGIQNAFYDDPRVMTISLHETGRYLFPGTGDLLELGRGSGRGYSVNIPLEPFTEDDSYIEVMNMILAPLLTWFAPDVLVTMHGCDVHAWDPLTHLHLSMRGIRAQAQLAHQLAHTYSAGRWVALGGGGYDLYRVVPRAWSLLWTEMADLSVPEELPQTWVNHWEPVWQVNREREEQEQYVMGKKVADDHFPTMFLDRREDVPTQPRRDSISQRNRETAVLARRLLLPSPIRQAFPVQRRHTQFSGLFDLLHGGGSSPSRSKELQTPRGPVILRDFCPPSLVERLHVEQGLHAFARLPEREQQLLLSIAKSPDCALALAHTTEGEIIGQVTIAPLDDWWEGLDNAYEVAIEVSTNWRGMDIAKSLLTFALELDALEDMLLVALGLSWHWDTEGLNMSPYRYRKVIISLFTAHGFTEYATTEPDISMEPANVMLVRIGNRVGARDVERFKRYIRRTPDIENFRGKF